MDTKVNFTLVGVFLVTFILGVVGFTFWLGKYGNKSEKTDIYKIYLEESVAGLNIESSIKYKGLDVGAVKDIKINPSNSEQIEILVEIDGGTPIKTDTVAVLEAQGITGLKFINLTGGLNSSETLKTNSQNIAVIQSKKSFFGSLGDSAQDMTKKVNDVLDKINYLFNEKNLQNISNLIENTNRLFSDENLKNINSMISNANSVSNNVNSAVVNLDKKVSTALDSLEATLKEVEKLVSTDAKVSIQNIAQASNSAKLMFEKLTQDLNDGKFDIKQITSSSLKRFDKLMLEFDRTMQNAEKMIDKYSDSPSDIIFKSRGDNFGPGEKMSKILFKITISLLGLLVFSGCMSRTLPPLKTFHLDSAKECCKKDFETISKILQVLEPTTNKYLNSTSLYYSDNKYQLETYKLSKWSDYPSKMILEVLISKLDELNLYKNVITNNIYSKPHFILQSELFDFKQILEDESSFVKFRIKFYLIDGNNQQKIESKTFDYKVKCETTDAYGAIKAFNKSIDLLLNDLSLWLYVNTKEN